MSEPTTEAGWLTDKVRAAFDDTRRSYVRSVAEGPDGVDAYVAGALRTAETFVMSAIESTAPPGLREAAQAVVDALGWWTESDGTERVSYPVDNDGSGNAESDKPFIALRTALAASGETADRMDEVVG